MRLLSEDWQVVWAGLGVILVVLAIAGGLALLVGWL